MVTIEKDAFLFESDDIEMPQRFKFDRALLSRAQKEMAREFQE
jgi:hypothetical protein